MFEGVILKINSRIQEKYKQNPLKYYNIFFYLSFGAHG